jgi:argininosuccinate lyase
VEACLRAYCGIVPGIHVRREALLEAAAKGLSTATDLADYLAAKGVPFRDAHAIVGRIVQFAIRSGKGLSDLKLAELRRFSEVIDRDVYARLELKGSVTARDHIGGTAPRQVRTAVRRLRRQLALSGRKREGKS